MITAKEVDAFNRTIVGAAQSYIIARYGGSSRVMRLATLDWSYVDQNFSSQGGGVFNNKTTGFIGRVTIFDSKITASMFSSTPDAAFDYTGNGFGVPIFDKILCEPFGQIQFPTDNFTHEGVVENNEHSQISIVLARGWDSPPAVTPISFIPRLHCVWKTATVYNGAKEGQYV